MCKQKKLLILGGNILEKEIVNRAKKLGYYTIVTDNHTDWNLSPAKIIADEGWNISWSDVDELEKKCKEEGVHGVLAGFSEFRVENMIKLCNRLHLPCSLTMEQLEVTRDKILFKDTCRKYGINTIPEHNIEDADIPFPVIVKPVDRAGSIGINVAHDKDELMAFYDIAYGLSPSKHVIIEDFISDGTKVDVYYYVKDHKISFLGSSDTIMCKGEKGAKILQKAWPFKSFFEEQYLKEVDAKVRKMFVGLGINNAYATMSAFFCNGQFYFFEAGFRLSGELSYHYYEAICGLNYMDSMIKYSMDEADSVLYKNCVNKDKHCIVLNFFALDGIVNKIRGTKALSVNPNVYAIQLYVGEQENVKNVTNVFRKAAMFTIISNTETEMLETVAEVSEWFDVFDESGHSLVYEKVSSKELNQYYKKWKS